MIRFARAITSSSVVARTRALSPGGTSPRSTYQRARNPPSRGMSRIDPPSCDWMAHLVRTSGKSVTARMSITPQAWLARSPTGLRPMACRTALCAPSAPIT